MHDNEHIIKTDKAVRGYTNTTYCPQTKEGIPAYKQGSDEWEYTIYNDYTLERFLQACEKQGVKIRGQKVST